MVHMEQVFPDWEQDEVMDAFFSYSVEEMEKSRENVPALAFWEKLFHWMMIGYWYNHVTEIIEESNEPSFYFNPTVFTKKCIRQGVSPMPETIDAVVHSLVQSNKFIHESSFLQTMENNGSIISWLVNWTLKKPTLWVLRSTGIVSLNSRAHILEGNYISLALLQQAADLVYAHAHQLSPLDSTFCLPVDKHKTCSYAIPHPMEISFISFCRKSGFIVEETNEMKKFLTEMQIEECVLVAQYLAHTNRAIYTPNYVRFLSAVEIKEKEPRNITTADQSALKIRHVLLELEVSLQQLEAKIFKFKHEAIIYKRKNRMTEALQSFRLAKLLEEKLLERQQAHLNLIETEENIRHMYTQKEIVQAYSLATETMRNVRETLGLSVEKIDATMEEWKESLDVQKEIEDAIKVANETSLTAAAEAAGVIFDEEELEEELASLNIEQPSVAPLTVSSAETLEMPQTKSFIISAKTKLRPARPRKVIMS